MDSAWSAVRNNRGATLIAGLLTLVLLSLIGLAATSTSRMEVQISGNDKLYKEAFYTAEFGVTRGETVIEALLSRVDLNEGSIEGHYAQDTQPAWYDLAWTTDDSVQLAPDSIPSGIKMAVPPRYTIEQRSFTRDSLTTGIGVPTGVYRFNVTARGVVSRPNSEEDVLSEVVLETVYAKRFN
jgi:Tfp pilus assembly protein PilX